LCRTTLNAVLAADVTTREEHEKRLTSPDHYRTTIPDELPIVFRRYRCPDCRGVVTDLPGFVARNLHQKTETIEGTISEATEASSDEAGSHGRAARSPRSSGCRKGPSAAPRSARPIRILPKLPLSACPCSPGNVRRRINASAFSRGRVVAWVVLLAVGLGLAQGLLYAAGWSC